MPEKNADGWLVRDETDKLVYKTIGSKKIREVFSAVSNIPSMQGQEKHLTALIENLLSCENAEIVDDICVIGIKL